MSATDDDRPGAPGSAHDRGGPGGPHDPSGPSGPGGTGPGPGDDVPGGKGFLTVVGTGYRLGDISIEAKACLEQADRVFFLVEDSLTATWITRLNPDAVNLHHLYRPGKERRETYEQMIERVMEATLDGSFVCAAFYGHPGVFAYPMHEAVRRLRAMDVAARMIPGVCAEDWLFADLGLDPATSGCQSFEATDLLINRRSFDPTSLLVVWQIGVIGALDYQESYDYRANLGVLVEELRRSYPADHVVVTYEIAPYAVVEPRITRCPLQELSRVPVTPSTTLVVPPRGRRVSDPEMLARLGMPARSASYRVVPRPEGLPAEANEVPLHL